ncbi:hypothetical protein HY630_01690 [Candidatus Uhrbacteria bacterium]|nr:hypothetical protein [Candidatus Uhrbacteria bacterium]
MPAFEASVFGCADFVAGRFQTSLEVSASSANPTPQVRGGGLKIETPGGVNFWVDHVVHEHLERSRS